MAASFINLMFMVLSIFLIGLFTDEDRKNKRK